MRDTENKNKPQIALYSSRKQVEPAADQRARELAALQALGLAVSASLSLDLVWAAALRGALEAVQPDLAFLFLREGERLVLREVLPSEARPLLGIIPEHRVGECLCGVAVRDGGPIYSRDLHSDPRCTWKECKQAGIRSFAALPLRSDEEIIGVIGLASLTQRVFETQAGFLETLAHQVSVALANARLYEAAQLELNERKRVEEILKRRDRQLQILTQTTRTINATLEIPMVLRQLVASAIELTEAESGAAGLIMNNQVVFTEYNQNGQLIPIDYRFDPGYGVPGWVMQTRSSYLSADAERDPHVVPEIQKALGFRTLADVPIFNRDGELLGCFEIHNKGGGQPFTEQDLELLSGLAAGAAVALDNARMLAERNRAETTLRESEEHYRQLFDLESDALVVIDVETMSHLDANKAAEQMYGYTRQELLRLKSTDLSAEPEQTKARVQQDDGFVHIPLRWHRKKDGTVFPVDITARFFTLKGRRSLIVAMRDVTERKKAEEEKDALQEQLLQAQKMESVGRLAGGVAHDFNNMLSAILGHAELAIMQYSPSGPLLEDLKAIQRAAQRSADLTRQLLAFARKQTVAPKVLDFNDTVAGMLKLLLRLIGEDIDLVWMPAAGLWPVKIDPSQIDQLLANLCVNARDAIAGVGKVTIETENIAFDEAYCAVHPGFACGEYVKLAVSDDGCGMKKEVLDHLFEPFFTTKEVGKGTGLGLATVYGIVKQNEGFINVYSEPDKGTTLRIYLPRFVGDAVEPMAASPAETPMGRGETVLLVEDEAAILNVGRVMLERLGYTVVTAGTPGEALRLAEAHVAEIRLLITDVVMPEMNGRDLTKLIRDIKPGLECLFTSGYTASVIAHHGVLDKGVNFLQKPFSMKELASKVRQALERD